MIKNFHAYEKEICQKGLIPLLRKHGFDPSGKNVLDVGCGYGGVLAGLAGEFPMRSALGIDLDAVMITEGAGKSPPGVVLEVRDFHSLEGAPTCVVPPGSAISISI
ncbi:MAG: class I SAM-dependent methyltransferase [Fibrobacterota bacterium]|nr:class I SAM-dependent methyltransferase [Fibrobacterota bacterium]